MDNNSFIIKLFFIFIAIIIVSVLVKPKMDNFCSTVKCTKNEDCVEGMTCVDGCCKAS